MENKRPSKLFGSRILSIFSHGSQDHLVPQNLLQKASYSSLRPHSRTKLSTSVDLGFYFDTNEKTPEPQPAPSDNLEVKDAEYRRTLHSPMRTPTRKPPPSSQELLELPSMLTTAALDDIIDSLDSEINRISLEKQPDVSPLPEPQTFLFLSPTKSINYSSDMVNVSNDDLPDPPAASDVLLQVSNADQSVDSIPSYGGRGLDPTQKLLLTRSQGSMALSDLNGSDNDDVPYPIDSPVAPSLDSQLFVHDDYDYDNAYSAHNASEDIVPDASDSSNSFTQPPPIYPTTTKGSLGSASSLLYSPVDPLPAKSIPLASTSSLSSRNAPVTPFARTNTTSSSSRMGSLNFTPKGSAHRKSSSISSLISTGSFRNVNLATLKKTLNLRPGEGEVSDYVLAIRRNAGTAYNESGPGKWKLPTGIQPVDRKAVLASSGRYMRMAASQSRAKKVSGVELKHGHLAPRLLAAEVNDFDDLSPRQRVGAKSVTESPRSNGLQSSNSSLWNGVSRQASLARSTTVVSESPSVSTPKSGSPPVTRQASISSSSSEDVGDANVGYQHPGYRYDKEEGAELETEVYYEEDYDEPRLVLANPDNSDSD